MNTIKESNVDIVLRSWDQHGTYPDIFSRDELSEVLDALLAGYTEDVDPALISDLSHHVD